MSSRDEGTWVGGGVTLAGMSIGDEAVRDDERTNLVAGINAVLWQGKRSEDTPRLEGVEKDKEGAAEFPVNSSCMFREDEILSTLPRPKRVLLLFSGPYARVDGLGALLTMKGFEVIAVDSDPTTGGGASHDVQDDSFFNPLLARVAKGDFFCVVAAPPCSTFSVCRFMNDSVVPDGPGVVGRGPPIVRSRAHPHGVPEVPHEHRRELALANSLVSRTVLLLAAAHASGTEFVLENPVDRGNPDAFFMHKDHCPLWVLPEIMALRDQTSAECATFAQCRFGAESQKQTMFMYSAGLRSRLGLLTAFQCECPSHTQRAGGQRMLSGWNSKCTAAFPERLNQFICEGISTAYAKFLPNVIAVPIEHRTTAVEEAVLTGHTDDTLFTIQEHKAFTLDQKQLKELRLTDVEAPVLGDTPLVGKGSITRTVKATRLPLWKMAKTKDVKALAKAVHSLYATQEADWWKDVVSAPHETSYYVENPCCTAPESEFINEMNQLDEVAVAEESATEQDEFLLKFEVECCTEEEQSHPILMCESQGEGKLHPSYIRAISAVGTVEVGTVADGRQFVLKEGQSYQSMAALIKVSTGEAQLVKEQRVVVDTGAAWCAISRAVLATKYPIVYSTMIPSTKLFLNASNKPMHLAGQVDMTLWLQDFALKSTVFVFEDAVPFLLGTNAMMENSLIVHTGRQLLYPEVMPQAAVELEFARPSGLAKVCHCPDSSRCSQQETTTETVGLFHCAYAEACDPCWQCHEASCRLVADLPHGELRVEGPGVPVPLCPTVGVGGIPLRTRVDQVIPPGELSTTLTLVYDRFVEGPECTLEVNACPKFVDTYRSQGLVATERQLHTSRNAMAFVRCSNCSEAPIKIPAGTLVAYASPCAPKANRVMGRIKFGIRVAFDATTDGTPIPFDKGGPPITPADFDSLGFSLEKSVDPTVLRPDGTYAPLKEEDKLALLAQVTRWHHAFARDARVPNISRLIVIEIPTGDNPPVQQRPYGLPYAYREAVKDEMQKLLDAGLIESSTSQFSSPTLCTVKKDSTTDQLKVKIVGDYRRLNQITIPDAGGLGDQGDIMDSFGSGHKCAGLCDAAGGFYQFSIKPSDRHKTSFVLPMSLGGTSFQWRVAPYGLQRNPAGYSRGMMFALRGLDEVSLAPLGTSQGGCLSWIDDIILHATSVAGFIDLFGRLLQRIVYAGMSLKASKCHLLHALLEVLGFMVSPEGIHMQPDKVDAICRMKCPSNMDEVRVYLGAVNFYRRFVPRMAMMATPLTNMTKKGQVMVKEEVEAAFVAINSYLLSTAVVYPPDLRDPLAEYLLCPDACDVAAGGVLLQWQHPQYPGMPAPAGTRIRGEPGKDPLTQSWRLSHGWKLRTIGYYSKTFNSAQKNYPTFDKESGAILLCIRHWVKLITGHYTTVYTDSAVAATMLTKHAGPARLQRWGMELGTFLPHLKIAYRQGVRNGMADLLSRFPTFTKYVGSIDDETELPDDLFEKVGTAVFGHNPDSRDCYDLFEAKIPQVIDQIWQETAPLNLIWEAQEALAYSGISSLDVQQDRLTGRAKAALPIKVQQLSSELLPWVGRLASPSLAFHHSREYAEVPLRMCVLQRYVELEPFHQKQRQFELYQSKLEAYVVTFRATMGRSPVYYDLYCGEGWMSRGARQAGFRCFGFDIDASVGGRYEEEPCLDGSGHHALSASDMKFTCADPDGAWFWENLNTGAFLDLPPPDVINVNPPYVDYSNVTADGSLVSESVREDLDVKRERLPLLITRLATLSTSVAVSRAEDAVLLPLQWQIVYYPESYQWLKDTYPDLVASVDLEALCGVSFGHQIACARVIYTPHLFGSPSPFAFMACNNPALPTVTRELKGEFVGRYKWSSVEKAHADDWHGALGYLPHTFSTQGLKGAVPLTYGRYTAVCRLMIALHVGLGMPLPDQFDHGGGPELTFALGRWMAEGYRPLGEIHFLNLVGPPRSMVCSAITSSFSGCTEMMGETQLLSMDDLSSGLGIDPVVLPYEITRQDQLRDPQWREVIRLLEIPLPVGVALHDTELLFASKRAAPPVVKLARQQRVAHAKWTLVNGLLYRIRLNDDIEPRRLLAVPGHIRGCLLCHYHLSLGEGGHRGGDILWGFLLRLFYWSNMEADCYTYCARCPVCGPIKSQPLVKVPMQYVATPSTPFHTIHLDHKTPGVRSGTFSHILVCVCALTRYVCYIPVSDLSGATTFRALLNGVFSIFGYPRVMISDNGTAFVNSLMTEMGMYLGFRHTTILPYNAGANGLAESCCKRIKNLLERHTDGFRLWHEVLPMASYALNSATHSITGVSPFRAIFGRDAPQVAELESAALLDHAETGSVFLRSLRARLQVLHAHIQAESDRVKNLAVDRQNHRHFGHKSSAPVLGPIQVGDFVWSLHGSAEQATYIRKHGHGKPWRRKYEVLELKPPTSVRLRVPANGIQEWQDLRRLTKAEPQLNPDVDVPLLSPEGVAYAPGCAPSEFYFDPGCAIVSNVPEEGYYVEAILRAEKLNQRWRLYIKWKDSPSVTTEWWSYLRDNAGDDVIRQCHEAMNRAKLEMEELPLGTGELDDLVSLGATDVVDQVMGLAKGGAPNSVDDLIRETFVPELDKAAELVRPSRPSRCTRAQKPYLIDGLNQVGERIDEVMDEDGANYYSNYLRAEAYFCEEAVGVHSLRPVKDWRLSDGINLTYLFAG